MKRILTCNIGNTNIQLANWIGEKIEKVIEIPRVSLCSEKITLKKPEFILVASTVPETRFELQRILSDKWDVEMSSVSREVDFGLDIEYEGKLGQDRIANIAGGYVTAGGSFIVLDFGTATTLDVVRDRKYLGGLILVGIDTGLKALHRYTSLLPRVKIEKPDYILGKSTEECMLSGAYWGEMVRIEGLIKRINKKGSPIIVTGGLGEIIAKESGYTYERWLTLKGIRHIAETIIKNSANRKN